MLHQEKSPSESHMPDRIVIGNDPNSPLVTIEQLSEIQDFENAKPLDVKRDKSISRLNPLLQAVPSLLMAGEASGKRLMQVSINGDLVRAADGNGLRAFAMNGNSISEHARLFELGKLSTLINCVAVWQIAAVVVAQKHLADISQKLDDILADIQHISEFLKNQRRSRMKASYDYLWQVYGAIMGGEFPDSSRIELESCERDLLEIQNHLEMDFRNKAEEEVEHKERFGTEELTKGINEKISDLEMLAKDISLCLKTRIAAWHLLLLYPGEPELKRARQRTIEESIASYEELADSINLNLSNDIDDVKAFWNKGSTLSARRMSLTDRSMNTANMMRQTAKESRAHLKQTANKMLVRNQPTRLYLQFENGELVGARQAVSG